MITRKIAISAGHSNKEGRDNGASYNGRVEGKEFVISSGIRCSNRH